MNIIIYGLKFKIGHVSVSHSGYWAALLTLWGNPPWFESRCRRYFAPKTCCAQNLLHWVAQERKQLVLCNSTGSVASHFQLNIVYFSPKKGENSSNLLFENLRVW